MYKHYVSQIFEENRSLILWNSDKYFIGLFLVD